MTTDSFKKLDQQVKRVVARVRELEKENEKLRLKAAKLESTIRQTPEPAADEGWQEEKAAVRARVESLAEHLEGVLES
jgi:predicted RNase H-like nuclease (RuvC/YqgF family)